MIVWCVFATYYDRQELLYIFKLKRDAVDAQKVEQENYNVSEGPYAPTITVERWEVE